MRRSATTGPPTRHLMEMTATTTKGQCIGLFSSIIVALGVTGLAASTGWTWALTEWEGWRTLSVVILIGAWVNVPAWMLRIWPLAIVCSLLTFLAPWGFIYPGILAGPIMATAAAVAWVRSERERRAA